MNMKKFLFVGIAGGISEISNAMSTVSISVASHIATSSHVTGHAQQAVQVVTDPANMTFLQQHPNLILGGISVAALAIVGTMSYLFMNAIDDIFSARKSSITPEKETSKIDSINNIKNLRNKFSTSENLSTLNLN